MNSQISRHGPVSDYFGRVWAPYKRDLFAYGRCTAWLNSASRSVELRWVAHTRASQKSYTFLRGKGKIPYYCDVAENGTFSSKKGTQISRHSLVYLYSISMLYIYIVYLCSVYIEYIFIYSI